MVAIVVLFVGGAYRHRLSDGEKPRGGDAVRASIVEATNDVPMGVCFSNPTGRIILCNNKLRVLANQLTGGYPQMMEERIGRWTRRPRLGDALPDGKLRAFRTVNCVYNFQYIGLTVGGERLASAHGAKTSRSRWR